ncbi:ABC transporter ATP-binding protein [Pseudomonas sp. 5P_3.1_Bac2]|uniref:ABC transporter ATP-binding protein n=1 Tax=Pseudomonas sp. 5P_3.1_Bac2 TaxID=2971617 RepID=UPI0021C5A2B1|nr:ABC transporter ATP-binding protein [Pseudomonas sp. 5P_3.1_Bac2]MCU1719238.1 ABC transporter ATP-binding protein [Pseudomonas sp. 5P_3.1_Bac2]
MLSLHQIEVCREQRRILELDQLVINPGEFTVILGHNGSGKSTLMNLLARQIEPDAGHLQLHQQPLTTYSQRAFAQQIAFLPQRLPEVPGLTVRELVRLGRYPWRGLLGLWQPQDHAIVEQAMAQTGTAQYAEHLADSLSGGERQRAWIAMLLAQAAPLILLDEPTSALDLAHQYQVLNLLRELNRQQGLGVVAILHDINLTCRYAQRIIALKQGRLFFDGSPQQLLDANLLSELYEIDIQLLNQPGQALPVAVVS